MTFQYCSTSKGDGIFSIILPRAFWGVIGDILITISGKAYKGEYVKIEGDKVLFIQQGAKKPVNIFSFSIAFSFELFSSV